VTAHRRGRALGLAFVLVLAVVVGGCGSGVMAAPPDAAPGHEWQLVVRDADAREIARFAVPGGRFALRYRNSVYGSTAEERFALAADGRIRLVELAADEAAVLAEYYTAHDVRAASGADTRAWLASPAAPLTVGELPLAATDHGRRTLLIPGSRAVPLWPLVAGRSPAIVLAVERAS
jgi:hypothetical protein